MNYFDWNTHIANYFFKPENAGKNIMLYLTKQDLINYSTKFFPVSSEDEIWNDFIYAIKFETNDEEKITTISSPISRPLNLFRKWNKIDTPPFIAYLVLYIIPLTESYEEPFIASNYYGKINVFFKRYEILNKYTEPTIGTSNYQNISHLWNALEEWSIITKNCDLGIFELKKFGNTNWIHVGKPFSQCVLSPRAITKLPELFFEAGFIPDSLYSKEEFRKILLKYGARLLQLKESIIDLIRKSDSHELGQSIIEIVIREYKKWTGETHEDEENGNGLRTRRKYTVVPLFLQFQVNENDELIKFSYRMYSSNDYPEDLKFGEHEDLYETNGWSKTLNFEFKNFFELNDNFNKWVARFPERDVRLFLNAGIYQLSNNYWIETESLSKTDPMYLLCKNVKRDSILEWGKTFRKGDFKEEDLDGLPQNYSLYKILNPVTSHPVIPLLTIYTEKRIELTEGLKVNFRTFANDYLPEVEISNADGNEKVFLQYRNTDEKIYLDKKLSSSNRWLLPTNTLLNADFYVKVEEENFAGNEIAYNLTSSDDSAIKVDGVELPKRDSFGRQISNEIQQYCLGSNILNPRKSSVRLFSPYGQFFTSIFEENTLEISKVDYISHCGNKLCGFISLKKVLTTFEFYNAFEFFYQKEFIQKHEITNINLTRTKKASLNFYDFIGILDYDYLTKKIVVNPPQLIFIPASKGRKVLLIGARDEVLIKQIIDFAPKFDLQVEIHNQFSSNVRLLLPDAIIIKAFGNSHELFGEKKLKAFAKEMNIKFSDDYYPQVAMLEFASTIEEYDRGKQLIDENDYGWARRVFNTENLCFERNESERFELEYELIEYKLNEYTYIHKLWANGKCYQVDKNWGRYLALKYFKKNVILFDSANKRVAIPGETPLPRLLSESIMLLSGLAPDLRLIDDRNYRVFENIPGIFTENLFHKLGQQPINTQL